MDHSQFIIDRNADGMTRDQIIINLASDGMSINAATKAYAAVAKAEGLDYRPREP